MTTPVDMTGRWESMYAKRPTRAHPMGREETYTWPLWWLDALGEEIVDWGGGQGYAANYIHNSPYRVVDGSAGKGVNEVADLRTYEGRSPCAFMRHVLEHNVEWRAVLKQFLLSFERRAALVTFLPFAEVDTQIKGGSMPSIRLSELSLRRGIGGLIVGELDVPSPPGTSRFANGDRANILPGEHEHVFLLSRIKGDKGPDG